MPKKEGTLAFRKHVEDKLKGGDWPGNYSSIKVATEPFGITVTTGCNVLRQIALEQGIPYTDLLPHPEYTHIGNGHSELLRDSLPRFDQGNFQANVDEILQNLNNIIEEVNVVLESCTMVNDFIQAKE